MLLAGRGAIARSYKAWLALDRLHAHREGRRYIVRSDELLSAFLELEATVTRSDRTSRLTCVERSDAKTPGALLCDNSAFCPRNEVSNRPRHTAVARHRRGIMTRE